MVQENTDDLYKKYSYLLSDETVGEKILPDTVYPQVPDTVLDLHGYFESEIFSKLDWFFELSLGRKYLFVRIITGKGQGVIHNAVKKYIQKNECLYSISNTRNFSSYFDIYF